MIELGIFLFGCFVTLIVSGAVSLLTYAAIAPRRGRDVENADGIVVQPQMRLLEREEVKVA